MNGKYRYLLKNTGLLTLSSFSSKLLTFFLVPLYTNVLTTEEYGIYDLIITTIQLIMPILTINVCDGVMRFLMDPEESKNDIVAIGIKYTLISTTGFGALLLINHFSLLWKDLAEYSLYVFAYYVSFELYQLASQMSRGLERVKDLAIAGVISTVCTVAFNIIFLLCLSLGLPGFFLAYILGQAIPAAYLLYKCRDYITIHRSVNKDLEKRLLAYSFPLVMNALGWWANSVSDRYVVTFFCGLSANGLYSVSYKIPTILNTVQGVFTQSWQISAIKEYKSKDAEHFFGNMIEIINVLMTILCSALIFTSKLLASILYAKDFFEAWRYVPVLLISCVINAVSGMIGPILSAEKQSKALAVSAVYGAVVNILLNVILVWIMDVQGAAIATAISSFVIYAYRKKAVKASFKIPNGFAFYFSWVLLSVQACCMVYFTDYLLQMVLFGCVCILHFKTFRKLLGKIKNRNRKER